VTPRSGPRRVAVVGGGVTGLAAAHHLVELAPDAGTAIEVSLFEAAPRLGGVVSSIRRDGFLIEEGPDSIITDKPWARQLAERIGIGHRLIGTQEEHRRSFVVRRGRLEPTPDGFYLLAPTRILPMATTRIFSPLGKLRMAMDLFIPARSGEEDESVAEFVTRRLGREALDRMAQPMIGGIYGADPQMLSLRATFPRFLQMEREHGSVIRAMLAAGRARAAMEKANNPGRASGPRYGLFVSFDEGLQVLTDALASRLPAGAARTGHRVTGLAARPDSGDARWELEFSSDGRGPAGRASFDAVILALHGPRTAALLGPVDGHLAEQVGSIAYATAATVSLAMREEDVAHPMGGFGFVVPTIEGRSIVGCTFGQRKYPGRAPAGHALIRAFWGDASEGLSEPEILARTMSDLRDLLGVRSEPIFSHVARWPRSMPHYAVGHLDRVDAIEARTATHPGLALAGNAYRGVGIPDCVHSGESAARRVIEQIASPGGR